MHFNKSNSENELLSKPIEIWLRMKQYDRTKWSNGSHQEIVERSMLIVCIILQGCDKIFLERYVS